MQLHSHYIDQSKLNVRTLSPLPRFLLSPFALLPLHLFFYFLSLFFCLFYFFPSIPVLLRFRPSSSFPFSLLSSIYFSLPSPKISLSPSLFSPTSLCSCSSPLPPLFFSFFLVPFLLSLLILPISYLFQLLSSAPFPSTSHYSSRFFTSPLPL